MIAFRVEDIGARQRQRRGEEPRAVPVLLRARLPPPFLRIHEPPPRAFLRIHEPPPRGRRDPAPDEARQALVVVAGAPPEHPGDSFRERSLRRGPSQGGRLRLPAVQVAARADAARAEVGVRQEDPPLRVAAALGDHRRRHAVLLALQEMVVRVAAGRAREVRERDVWQRAPFDRRAQRDAQPLVLLALPEESARREDLAAQDEDRVVPEIRLHESREEGRRLLDGRPRRELGHAPPQVRVDRVVRGGAAEPRVVRRGAVEPRVLVGRHPGVARVRARGRDQSRDEQARGAAWTRHRATSPDGSDE
mmetsp:Transcript_30155/g.93289  ORF Transcript_30155/g.93289 Transcript_30155/m.93289 type:complete len:306 (+) Transcript_30155:905-1822(+)